MGEEANSPSSLEDVVRGLNGKILAVYFVGDEFVVNYGGQSVKKGATIAGALDAAKANHDALAARHVSPQTTKG